MEPTEERSPLKSHNTRRDIAGMAYTPEELDFIVNTIRNNDILKETLNRTILKQFFAAEKRLNAHHLSDDALNSFLLGPDIRKASESFQMVPVTELPISAVAVGVKGRDAHRLQSAFTDNQKEHGMTGSASHPGLESKIGTLFFSSVDALTEDFSFEDMYKMALFGEHPLFQPRSWILDRESNEIWIAADGGIHYLAETGEYELIESPLFEAPHDVSINSEYVVVTCSSMDTLVFISKSDKQIKKITYLSDFGYRHSIGTKNVNGEERRLLYHYEDQETPQARHNELVVSEDRNEPIGVPTALQRLHPNAVYCLDDETTLVSFFNSVSLGEDGQLDNELSAGKIVQIETRVIDDYSLDEFLSTFTSIDDYSVEFAESAYLEKATGRSVNKAAFLTNKSNFGQRIVVKEIVENGMSTVEVEVLTEVLSGLRNPHGIVYLGEVANKKIMGVSDTNRGEFLIFSLDTETASAQVIQRLVFDDNLGVEKISGRSGNWIHHPRLMVQDDSLFLSVYDGKRSGIWLVELTGDKASFVAMPEDAVIYQTQAYPEY